MQDLVACHVPLVFDGLSSSAPQIRDGKLRVLAVTAPQHMPAFPDIRTAAEASVPGCEVATWYGATLQPEWLRLRVLGVCIGGFFQQP